MKSNVKYWVFMGIILLLAFSLTVGTLIFGPSRAAANEQLSKSPVLVDGAGKWNPDYLSDVVTWFSDHFFLRQELISLNNWLSAKVLHTSGADSVLLGSDGWLYYADTAADYSFTNGMTPAELTAAANNLALMAEYCEANGKAFLFTIAPNKNSLYPERMPGWIPRSEQSNAAALLAQLDALDVPYADLFAAFRKEEAVLYFAHDSHWNSKGAALGADVINRAFGVATIYYADAFADAKPHTGDLYEMLYPAFSDPETNPVYGGKLSFTYTGNGKAPDSILLETAGSGTGKLVAYRDSFGNLLYPYLADAYASAHFSRSTVYDLTLDADFVLIELVERNLRYLLRYVPVMPSPVREISIPETEAGTAAVTLSKGKAPQGCVQLKGQLDVETEKIFVICGGMAYEAFCLEDGGFGVNVPEGSAAEQVICSVDGKYQLLTVR